MAGRTEVCKHTASSKSSNECGEFTKTIGGAVTIEGERSLATYSFGSSIFPGRLLTDLLCKPCVGRSSFDWKKADELHLEPSSQREFRLGKKEDD